MEMPIAAPRAIRNNTIIITMLPDSPVCGEFPPLSFQFGVLGVASPLLSLVIVNVPLEYP